MKAILEFNLPEDNNQHHHAVRAIDYLLALHDVVVAFRNKRKYGEEQNTTWEEAEELLWDTLREAKVDPYEEE